MCFSANASFAASAVLIPSGGLCMSSIIANRKYRYLPLSAVPVFFGIQQFCEGMVWTNLALGEAGRAMCKIYSQAFLFFALSFWPVWMPFLAMMVEKKPRRRLWMALMMVIGLALGDFMFAPVASDTAGWLSTRVVCSSISYEYTGQLFVSVTTLIMRLVYLLVAGLPLILSTDSIVRRFGMLLVVSAGVTHAFYTYAFSSVWCFFAALMSGYLCWALSNEDDAIRALARTARRLLENMPTLRGSGQT